MRVHTAWPTTTQPTNRWQWANGLWDWRPVPRMPSSPPRRTSYTEHTHVWDISLACSRSEEKCLNVVELAFKLPFLIKIKSELQCSHWMLVAFDLDQMSTQLNCLQRYAVLFQNTGVHSRYVPLPYTVDKWCPVMCSIVWLCGSNTLLL